MSNKSWESISHGEKKCPLFHNNSDAYTSVDMSLNYMLDTLHKEIYLFFSNWFGYKRRESHTNKFLNASEHVLYCDLDADLKRKEK